MFQRPERGLCYHRTRARPLGRGEVCQQPQLGPIYWVQAVNDLIDGGRVEFVVGGHGFSEALPSGTTATQRPHWQQQNAVDQCPRLSYTDYRVCETEPRVAHYGTSVRFREAAMMIDDLVSPYDLNCTALVPLPFATRSGLER